MNNSQQIFSERCWVDGKLQPATISFENGIITAVDMHRVAGASDAGHAILMPGVIDAHVHVNEPGRTHWEGFETATKAAAAGGITSIVDMPLNASPVTTNLPAFEEKLAAAKNKLHVHAGFYGGLIPGNLQELEPMMQAGILGIKCFLTHSGIDDFPNVVEADINAAMPIIKKYGLPLLAHCELKSECADELDKFPKSYAAYLASRPKQWENDAINMMIRLCRKHQCRTHIVHVSSAEALEQIAEAKAEGLPLTAETCTHYIYFNAEDIPDADCLYKCAPPIREKANNDQLRAALANGVLDFIATDHSPAPPDIKELQTGNLQKAWGGIAGLQFLLPASWTTMKETISMEKFIPLLTERPAKFLHVDHRKGKLAAGYDADLVLWDPEQEFVVKPEDILHRYNCSPYNGKQLTGTVLKTIVNGITVFQDKQIIHHNAGQWLLKK